jgi:diguanylate cyclase (GGDEF)-like protein
MMRRYFPRQYVLPVILLLGTSFGCLFSLLYYLTAVQDRMEATREEQLVRNAVTSATEMAVHDLQDYAVWDDAVRNLVQTLNPEWADDNVGSYLSIFEDYTHLFVLDGTGRTIYSFVNGTRSAEPLDAAATIGDGLLPGLRDAAAKSAGDRPIVGGISRRDGRIYIYAASQIIPHTDKITLGPGGRHIMVLVGELKPAMIARWSTNLNAPNMTLTLDPAEPETGHVMLQDRDGHPLGQLVWPNSRPGTALIRQILPGFLAIGVVALFAGGAILRRARKNNEALHRSKIQAQYLANHDILTGLPNRREMVTRLRVSLPTERVDLLYMDLDGFKETNDVYGHATGDDLLREAAARISQAVGLGRSVVRAGGDEFAVLLFGSDHETSKGVADAILRAFDAPFRVGGYSVAVGVSIGIANNETPIAEDELIRRADLAMYSSKAGGKNSWCVYNPAMDKDNESRRELEGDLRIAVENDAITVVFQPIVEAQSERIVNVEALARWHHPTMGPISPDRFIPVAEQSGLINTLGRNVLMHACRVALPWGVDLSVNLSPAQFWDRGLAKTVREVLEQEHFPAERLELEITERYLLRRPDDAERILQSLRDLGVRIALDDFGCGFASIGYLQRLSFDSIKIDKSFVEDVATDPKAANLAHALIALGAALDLGVTAEGVETEEQARIMKLFGCNHLQGWLYGRPVTAEAMTEMLLAQQRVSLSRTRTG